MPCALCPGSSQELDLGPTDQARFESFDFGGDGLQLTVGVVLRRADRHHAKPGALPDVLVLDLGDGQR